MTKPCFFIIDSDRGDLSTLAEALTTRYGVEFAICTASTAQEALAGLTEMARSEQPVALVIASRSLPDGDPIVLLNQAQDLHPSAKRILLAHFLDPLAFDVISTAMRRGRIDYFINKPWEPRLERLYPLVDDLLMSIRQGMPEGPVPQQKFEAVRIVGKQWDAISQKLRDLFDRSTVPHGFYQSDSAEGREILAQAGVDDSRLPVLVFKYGAVLVQPTMEQIVGTLGGRTTPEPGLYDVAIIGAGPAGLAAGVYAASEGLRTVILERETIGGQAGSSSKIENYLGFPRGITGKELARRAFEQTWRFGAPIVFTKAVTGLRAQNGAHVVTLSDGHELETRAVVISTGVAYGKLNVPSLDRFHSAGVYYGAPMCDAPLFAEKEVVIVGAGNSGGQAAIHLAKYAEKVTIVSRGESLQECMSDYLIQQLRALPNVQVRMSTQVVEAEGDRRLRSVTLERTGAREKISAAGLFILIGGVPHTQWLPETIRRSPQGYILTGRELSRSGPPKSAWRLEREPFFQETSLPGVFAAGDVRCNASKRVAAAVGEGAAAIQMVHEYMRTMEAMVCRV